MVALLVGCLCIFSGFTFLYSSAWSRKSVSLSGDISIVFCMYKDLTTIRIAKEDSLQKNVYI